MRSLFAAALFLSLPSIAEAAPAQIAVYPLVECSTPGSVHLEIFSPWGRCASPTPILTERDFAHLERLQYGQPFLRADLTADARQRYYDFALANRLGFAAIRVDGHTTRIIPVKPLARPPGSSSAAVI